MKDWFRNLFSAVGTVLQGMLVTFRVFRSTYDQDRRTFTEHFEYPELPAPVAARYRGFHRYDLTTCIACDQCAKACPVDCIYIGKERVENGKGFMSVDSRSTTRSACFVPCASSPARSIASSWGRRSTSPATVEMARSSTLHDCQSTSLGGGRR